MKVVRKTLDIRRDLWRRVRVNSEASGVHLRDYVSYLFEKSQPVMESDLEARRELEQMVKSNRDLQAKTAAFEKGGHP